MRIRVRADASVGGGFRQEWITATDDDGNEFGIDSGAGLGNQLLTFWIHKKGCDRRYYTADVGKLIGQCVLKTFDSE